MENSEINQLGRSSRRSAFLSLLGILIFIGSLIYASISLSATTSKLEEAEENFRKLSSNINNLKGDEKKLTDFLIRLIKSSSVNSVNSREKIDWDKLSKFLIDLPSGKRKTAIFIALLTTWKEIPFELGKESPSLGFDSPGFLSYVIGQVGINVEKKPTKLPSIAIMESFKKVEKPLPGDLIFYRGQQGNFGLMYVCDCTSDGQGLAIGTLQRIAPLSIYETNTIMTGTFPMIGYYRINYEDYD